MASGFQIEGDQKLIADELQHNLNCLNKQIKIASS